MFRVAHHLQKEAIGKEETERDAFARSAYNRYYYSIFLMVREMLIQFDASWARLAHQSYPETLKGKITKRYKQAKTRANKNRDYALVTKLEDGIRATAELASLMEKAYGTRVVADYEPS